MTKNTYEEIGYGRPDKKPSYQDLTTYKPAKRAPEPSPILKDYMIKIGIYEKIHSTNKVPDQKDT